MAGVLASGEVVGGGSGGDSGVGSEGGRRGGEFRIGR